MYPSLLTGRQCSRRYCPNLLIVIIECCSASGFMLHNTEKQVCVNVFRIKAFLTNKFRSKEPSFSPWSRLCTVIDSKSDWVQLRSLLKYSLLPRMLSSCYYDTVFVLDESNRSGSYAVETPNGLPEHIVGLQLIGIPLMPEILQDSILDYFTIWTPDFHVSTYRGMQKRFSTA